MYSAFRNAAVAALVLLAFQPQFCAAQWHSGDWAFGASTALPTGVSAVLLSNAQQNAIGSAVSTLDAYEYKGGSEICYQLSSSLQLHGGVGIGMTQFARQNGTAEDPQSTACLAIGLRSYLKAANEVSPYLGFQLSYSMMPSRTSGTTDTKCSLLMAALNFGVEAFVSKHVAVFSQIGLSYGSASLSQTTNSALGSIEQIGTITTLGLANSALGLHLYW